MFAVSLEAQTDERIAASRHPGQTGPVAGCWADSALAAPGVRADSVNELAGHRRMRAVRTFRRRSRTVRASPVEGAPNSSSRRSRHARHSTAEPRAIV